MRALTFAVATALMLSACGGPGDTDGLTRSEQRELDDAAAQLDSVQDDLDSQLEQAAQPDPNARQETDTQDEPEH